jgi:hypothetical protein
MAFDIQLDQRQLRRLEVLLSGYPGAVRRVIPRALNRTATSARSRVVKGIAAEINLRQKDIRRGVTVDRAKPTRHVARITIKGRRVPLIKFGARQTRKGVTARVRKRGGRELHPGAFIATMPTGHVGVFERKRRSRLPIREKRGPSIVEVFEESVAVTATRDIGAILEKNLTQQIRFILSGAEQGRRRVA